MPSLTHPNGEGIDSDPLLEELADVLNRPRIRDKYHLGNEDIKTVLMLILLRGEMVVLDQPIAVCRYPKDSKVLEVATAGRADVVESGDEDLLVLSPFEDIPIVDPVHFLEILERTRSS